MANFVIPIVILSIRRLRTITGCVIASCGIVVGMWLERFFIVVPSLSHKYLPYSFGSYSPQPIEILIMVATFAAIVLLYVLFTKFVPIISIWELKAGEHTPPALYPDGTKRHPLGELHLRTRSTVCIRTDTRRRKPSAGSAGRVCLIRRSPSCQRSRWKISSSASAIATA